MKSIKVLGGERQAFLVILAATLCFAQDNLRCYDCKLNRKNSPGANTDCLYNLNDTYQPRYCQSHERICKVEVLYYNRFIQMFERDCVAECKPGCKTYGFAVTTNVCTYCCTTDGCNDFNSAGKPPSGQILAIQIGLLASAFLRDRA